MRRKYRGLIPAHFILRVETIISSSTAAFFDLDGTLTKAHVWHGIMEYFKAYNLRRWTHRAYMAYHYPLYIFYKMGLISEGAYRKPWPSHLGWYLRGYSVVEADQVWYWVIENFMNQYWREDTCQVLEKHRRDGHITVLVSGTPTPLLERIGEKIGVDHTVGTDLEIREQYYTGRSLGDACIDENKVNLTYQYMDQHGIDIDYQASYAYADSISDLSILNIVGHPVATYPDERLRDLALKQGWEIYPSE